MSDFKTYEYIWLDGYTPEANMRSKVKATDEDTAPDWSFDGSSTLQAEGGSSDCLLLPVQTYENPNGHDLVMTQVQAADHTTHPSNFRAAAAEFMIQTPPKIVISEFLEIAKSFFPNGKECKLANGVLDKLATQILST